MDCSLYYNIPIVVYITCEHVMYIQYFYKVCMCIYIQDMLVCSATHTWTIVQQLSVVSLTTYGSLQKNCKPTCVQHCTCKGKHNNRQQPVAAAPASSSSSSSSCQLHQQQLISWVLLLNRSSKWLARCGRQTVQY